MWIIVFVVMVWISSMMAMDSDVRNYEKHFQLNPFSEFEHYRTHAQDISFIRASNNPLTTAVAIGNCEYCLKSAIEIHNSPSCGGCWRAFKCWWFNKIDEDVVHAAWHLASHKGNRASGNKYFQRYKLLKHVPCVTDVVRAGRPILFHAVRCMNEDMVDHLLRYRADPNQMSDGEVVYAGHTPLMLAVHMEDGGDFKTKKRIVQRLLQYGANVNVRRKETCDTALLLAQEPEIVSLLIDKGAYVDDKDKDGKTVFDSAIFTSSNSDANIFPELMKKILVKGALRPLPSFCPYCETSQCTYSCRMMHAKYLQRIMEKLKHAGIPRDVCAKILNYFSPTTNLCSVSLLTILGDAITPEHCAFAAQHIPERVFATVARRLPPDKKSIFAKRMTHALLSWRLMEIRELVDRKPVCDVTRRTYFEFIQEHVPEYRNYYSNVICASQPDGTRVWSPSDSCPDRKKAWPPHSLEADIREHYNQMFGS